MIMFKKSKLELICDAVLESFGVQIRMQDRGGLYKLIAKNLEPIKTVWQTYHSRLVVGILLAKIFKVDVCTGCLFSEIGRRLVGDDNAEA